MSIEGVGDRYVANGFPRISTLADRRGQAFWNHVKASEAGLEGYCRY
jgi:hypothetical protein